MWNIQLILDVRRILQPVQNSQSFNKGFGLDNVNSIEKPFKKHQSITQRKFVTFLNFPEKVNIYISIYLNCIDGVKCCFCDNVNIAYLITLHFLLKLIFRQISFTVIHLRWLRQLFQVPIFINYLVFVVRRFTYLKNIISGLYLYMLVVETFSSDKLKFKMYAVIGWGKWSCWYLIFIVS